MTSNTLMRAHQLISRAYELPRDARDAFLARESAADPELRQELAWMVAALRTERGGDDDFLEGAPSFGPMPAQLHAGGEREYRLVRPLGEGGMGAVWLAERSDGEFTQQVALKTLNVTAAMLPDLVARFGEERRILASLAHPNIAHVIDGGTTADGRPYLAIEYVDGEHIDQYCRERSLSLRERVALFLKVCAAVNHAHQHLVIHRDIKPSNILVTPEGEPKLLDFGIARLVDDAQAAARTATGLRFMTIAYASPEQVRGDALGTATDVYSLGMVLYELLAGARPWAEDLTQPQLVRAICDDEPVAPSAMHARTTRRRGEIPRDLDAIVLKALRKKPADRYASVQSLADDLKRFLTLQPVSARRGHAAYRAGKWFARHHIALLWSGALVALAVWFVVSRELSLTRLAEETRRAEQVGTLFRAAFSATGTAAGARPYTVLELLDVVARDATGGTMAPDVRAEALEAVGDAYFNYRANERAAPLLLGAWALRRQLGDVAGEVRLGQLIGLLYTNSGRTALAEPWLRATIARARAHFGPDARETIDSEVYLVVYLVGWTQGRDAEIREILKRSDALYAGHFDGSRNALRALVQSAGLAFGDGRYDDAAARYRELASMTQEPAVRANLDMSYADALYLGGRADEAYPEAVAALEAHLRIVGRRHPDVLPVYSLSLQIARGAGDWAPAVEYTRAMREIEALPGNNPNGRVWARRDIAMTQFYLGAGDDDARFAEASRALADDPALPPIVPLLADLAWLATRTDATPPAERAQAAIAMRDAAAAMLKPRELPQERYDIDVIAADALNLAGRFDETLAHAGALTAAGSARLPRDQVDLLRAEAQFRRDGDAAPLRQVIARVFARAGDRCLPELVLARRIAARSPGAIAADASAKIARDCAALPKAGDTWRAPSSTVDDPGATR